MKLCKCVLVPAEGARARVHCSALLTHVHTHTHTLHKSHFKNRLKVQSLSAENFEVQCVKVESATTPLMYALVYRPPKSDKHFIKEFSDFFVSS